MLYTVSRKIKILLFLILISKLGLAGNQDVNVALSLVYPGASQKTIGNQLVVDLGFLQEGENYQGGKRIHVGVVNVSITQTKTAEDISGCLLENITLDSVNIPKLRVYGGRIMTNDKIYVGSSSGGMILTEGNVRNVVTDGDVGVSGEDLYFVDSSCVMEGLLPGQALVRLSYEFDLYAEIPTVVKGSVIGSFAQDGHGVQLSLKDLIINQIQSTVIGVKKGSKRSGK